MPKQKKTNTTQPPTKRQSPRTANSNVEHQDQMNSASGMTHGQRQQLMSNSSQLQETGEQLANSTSSQRQQINNVVNTQREQTEEQTATSTATQQQQPLTVIANKLMDVITLLTTSLNTQSVNSAITSSPTAPVPTHVTQQQPMTQQQPSSLTEISSKLTDMITLLTNSLSTHQVGNPTPTAPVPTRTNQSQQSSSNDESAEVLSEVSDNPPAHRPPAVRIMATDTSQHSTSDRPFISSRTPTVSLPPVTAKLREKIISGEFVDFNLTRFSVYICNFEIFSWYSKII